MMDKEAVVSSGEAEEGAEGRKPENESASTGLGGPNNVTRLPSTDLPGSAHGTPARTERTPSSVPPSPATLKRKASLIDASATGAPASPTTATGPPHKRPSIDLRSAWSASDITASSPRPASSPQANSRAGISAPEHMESESLGLDQSAIDLSDVIGFENVEEAEGGDVDMEGQLARMEAEERELREEELRRGRYEAKEVVWRGRVSVLLPSERPGIGMISRMRRYLRCSIRDFPLGIVYMRLLSLYAAYALIYLQTMRLHRLFSIADPTC